MVGLWRGRKSTVVAVTDRRLMSVSASPNVRGLWASLSDIDTISIDRPEQQTASVRFGMRPSSVQRIGSANSSFQTQGSLKAIEFVDVRNPDELKALVETAVSHALH